MIIVDIFLPVTDIEDRCGDSLDLYLGNTFEYSIVFQDSNSAGGFSTKEEERNFRCWQQFVECVIFSPSA